VLYELYQVAQEALSNAFRHAHADNIAVAIRYGAGSLHLSVTDDGVGFEEPALEPDQGGRHWGLLGMRERVEKLGGQMSLRSDPGHGTVVSVTIPAAVAYQESSLISRLAGHWLWSPRSRSHSRE